MHKIIKFWILHKKQQCEDYFPDWRDVYRSEHLPGILCTSWNMFSGYIPASPQGLLSASRLNSVIHAL